MAEFQIKKSWEFIPEWNQANVPKGEEPVKFVLKALTHNQRAHLMPWETTTNGMVMRPKYSELFATGTESILGLVINGKQITRPQQLLEESGFDDLWQEVAGEIIAGAERKPAKN